MKKWVITILIVACAAAFINDVGRYFTVSYNLDQATRTIAQDAAALARKDPGNAQSGWPAAQATAYRFGFEVTGYVQGDQLVVITTRAPIGGTWVAGPVIALVNKLPWQSPFYATGRAESYYR
ncbi:MAG: hypothetical protein Q7W30_03005 [Coriobacteriia bacterium]|nr:hypothetical protein [Coriobacteriia bacterium]